VDANDLIVAIRAGDVNAVRGAIDADPSLARSRDSDGVSMVCLAVYAGQEEIARVLTVGRDDLDLFEASTVGDLDRVSQLLAARPEVVGEYSPDGFHALGYTCFFGRQKLLDVLLGAGADVEAPARNPMRVRPIHSAVAHSDPDLALRLASRLLSAGASPNVVQQNDFTPLHEAALRGHEELVRLLLLHGAESTARNADGKTAADLARAGGHRDIAALLDSGV